MNFSQLNERIERISPEIVALRRDLHANPEPGYEEHRTAQKVTTILSKIQGINIRSGIAETGIAATIGEDKTGPCVALRADMDCLPITEITGLPYASTRKGYMHACGHDGHTAMLVGAGLVLGQIQDELAGPVKLIFQPAEEGGAGGKKMCQQGVLESPEVDAIFGLHNNPGQESVLGDISVKAGPYMAASGSFDIVVKGSGGHAATPHHCIDPVFVSLQIGQALQAIVARETDPIDSAVVSITKISAGNAYNVIPPAAHISGTFRSLDDGLHKKTEKRIKEIAHNIAAAFNATCEITTSGGYPVLYNHESTTRLFKDTISQLPLYADKLKSDVRPIMGGEDFAYYLKKVPGTFYFLGTRPREAKSVPFCHNPAFDFNDDIVPTGIALHVEVARRFAYNWQKL